MSSPHDQLGPYLLDSPLAKGAMGSVWRAQHIDTGVAVALKVARDQRASTHDSFATEVQLMAALDHPHIVRIFDFGSAESDQGLTQWFAMELAHAGTLKATLGRWQWNEAKLALLAVLSGLAHAHAHGIIHRDLKPTNLLMMGPQPVDVRLGDLGIGVRMDQSHGVDVRVGTPAYMAPEQIVGTTDELGPWTDLYALGSIAYALVSGRPPFVGLSPQQTAQAQVSEPIPPLSPRIPVPHGFEQWVSSLLVKDPDRRVRTAAAAAWELRQLGEAASKSVAGPVVPTAESTTDLGTMSSATTDQDADVPRAASTSDDTVAIEQAGSAAWSQTAVRMRSIPLPEDWRSALPPQGAARVPIGLGLFGLRTVPMVGRETIQDALWRALEQTARTGSTGAIALVGDAGVGKSRLADWLASTAHELGGVSVLRVRTAASTDQLLDAVSRTLSPSGTLDARTEARARRHLALLGDSDAAAQANQLMAALHRPGEHNAGQLRDALQVGLRLVAHACPLIVVLQDGVTAGTLRTLAQCAPPATLAVWAEEPGAPIECENPTGGFGSLEHIDVPPLDNLGIGRLLDALIPLEASLNKELRRLSLGYPMWAVQVLTEWVENGHLAAGADGYQLADGLTPKLPPNLGAAYRDNVATLWSGTSDQDRLALAMAAALGLEVSNREWATACTEQKLSPSADLVQQLAARRLAVVHPDGSWRFAHVLAQRAVADESRRAGSWRDCHATILSMLQSASPPVNPRRLIHHAVESGQIREALDPLFRAADTEDGRTDLAGRLHLIDQGIAIVSELGLAHADPLRLQLENRWADVLRLAGKPAESADAAATAIEHARAHADPRYLRTALSLRASAVWELGDAESAIGLLQQALELDIPQRHHSGTHFRIAQIQHHLGQREQTAESLRAAALAASSEEAQYVRMYVNMLWAREHLRAGDVQSAEVCNEEAFAIATRRPFPVGEADCWSVRAHCARARGALDLAEQHFRTSIERHIKAQGAAPPHVEVSYAMLQYDHGTPARALGICLPHTRAASNPSAAIICALACLARLDRWSDFSELWADLDVSRAPADPWLAKILSDAAIRCQEAVAVSIASAVVHAAAGLCERSRLRVPALEQLAQR